MAELFLNTLKDTFQSFDDEAVATKLKALSKNAQTSYKNELIFTIENCLTVKFC